MAKQTYKGKNMKAQERATLAMEPYLGMSIPDGVNKDHVGRILSLLTPDFMTDGNATCIVSIVMDRKLGGNNIKISCLCNPVRGTVLKKYIKTKVKVDGEVEFKLSPRDGGKSRIQVLVADAENLNPAIMRLQSW